MRISVPPRRRRVALVAMAAVLLTAGCNEVGPSKAALGPQRTGGTLYILGAPTDINHLDPGRSYEGFSETLSRDFIRTLTMYAPQKLPAPKVVGDLATDAGTPSDNGRTWTYHLRDGITYQNGQPITAQDIKYGVERAFDPDLTGAPPYAAAWIDGASKYQGPQHGELNSVVTPDAKTIVFKLDRPVPDFNYFTTYPMFSGVPKALDTGVRYDQKPVSSGPYEIQSYAAGRSLELVRNPKWSQASDPNRTPYPDKIDYQLGLSQSVITQRLIANQGNDKYAMELATIVDPSSVASVLNDPRVKGRAVSGSTGGLQMLAMDNRVKPFNNLLVRQAIQYAVNKNAYSIANGGPLAGGVPTSTLLPSTGIPGYKHFDLYPTGKDGDPAKAKQMLAQAGYPHGFTVTMDVNSGTPTLISASETVQTALKRAGVTVKLRSLAGTAYTQTILNPATTPPLAIGTWGYDWPFASTILPPLFDGRLIKPNANNNYPLFNNAGVNALIDRINQVGNQQQAASLYGDLDELIMKQSPVVPMIETHKLLLHGSEVQNCYITANGTFDPLAVSVTS